MKSLLARFLVVVVVTGVLATVTGAAPREITLRFPSWQQDEPGVSGWWKEQITAFERAHPGVRIEFTKAPLAEHTDKLIAQFTAGQPPQIVHVPAQTFFPFADRGWLESAAHGDLGAGPWLLRPWSGHTGAGLRQRGCKGVALPPT